MRGESGVGSHENDVESHENDVESRESGVKSRENGVEIDCGHLHSLEAIPSSSPFPWEEVALERDVYSSAHNPFPTAEKQSRQWEIKERYSPKSIRWKQLPPPESPHPAANQSSVSCIAQSWSE